MAIFSEGMGQLLVKFKELRDKLELSKDRSKQVSSQRNPSERKSLKRQDESKGQSRDYGATAEIDPPLKADDLSKKFEMMERILENQRKFLEDHHVKIQDIENVIQTIVVDKKEKENQRDTDVHQVKPELVLDRCTGSTNVNDDEVRPRDLHEMLQSHEQILDNHTEQLEETCTKIETIREMLDDSKGYHGKSLKKKLQEYEGMLRKQCENYEKLKKEIEDQLQLQQKLQDNMLAGFIVGFVIMVMISLMPRTLLTPG